MTMATSLIKDIKNNNNSELAGLASKHWVEI